MSREKRQPEESSPKVPAYIVTFSDMVTLLLTFFVMLLTLAEVQDPELFDSGRDSFVKSIRYMGLGMLDSRSVFKALDKTKIKYSVPETAESTDLRLIDYQEELLRRMFGRIDSNMETKSSRLESEAIRFSVTEINFPVGSFELDTEGRRFLSEYADNIVQTCQSGSVKLCVIAVADDVRGRERQWLLSARRALAVERFLSGVFPLDFDCPVYSAGDGPDTLLIGSESAGSNCQVFIAVLRNQQR